MGKRGPAPKPTNLRVLHGDRKDRINTREPQPGEGDVVPPWRLSKAAQGHWDRMAPDRVAKGVLTRWDVEAFAIFCEALVVARGKLAGAKRKPEPGAASGMSEWRAAMQVLSQLGARFGWTPSDRAQLTVGEEPVDALERFGS